MKKFVVWIFLFVSIPLWAQEKYVIEKGIPPSEQNSSAYGYSGG